MALASPVKVLDRIEKTVTSFESRLAGVTLQLTVAEAETLVMLAHVIGGDKDHSRRKHTTAISAALQRAGIHNTYDDKYPQVVRPTFFRTEIIHG